MSEGYIKFECVCKNASCPSIEEVRDLIKLRDRMHLLGFIGVLPDGIGFGNISKRSNNSIIISGSGTGKYAFAAPSHFVKLLSYTIDNNYVEYSGEIPPSSESMTHTAVYDTVAKANFVLHIHNKEIWEALKKGNHATDGSADYGTVEIAREVSRYCRDISRTSKIFALPGHENGVMLYGESIDEISQILNQNS